MAPSENYADRRQAPRIPVRLRANLRISVPENTDAQVMKFGVETCDISQFGMRVSALNVPPEYYSKIMTAIRLAVVKINLPGSPDPVRLRGRIVWMDYNVHAQPPVCQFGLFFENQTPEESQALARAIGILQEACTR